MFKFDFLSFSHVYLERWTEVKINGLLRYCTNILSHQHEMKLTHKYLLSLRHNETNLVQECSKHPMNSKISSQVFKLQAQLTPWPHKSCKSMG